MRLFQNLRFLLPVACSIIAGLWITYFLDTASKMTLSRPDPSSFSDSSKIRTTSLNLVLSADLQQSVLSGFVDITFERIDPTCQSFVLDSKDLNIEKVTDPESNELKYDLSEKYKDFGSPMTVQLNSNTNSIRIYYKTSPEASGVQVLSPEQTLGGRHPYLFTQNQAIHARSIVPCQDTPGVKAPYFAQITVTKPLVAVMSAVSVKTEDHDNSRTFFFEQKTPIPSYLIAIVIGDIVFKDISPRVRVWSEKENIDDCFYEFGETDQILQTAESIAGTYVWGRYDLLVLPPSFPYGGMENPCLTFVTPTLLAGDRSLVNVVAHEIAHSWTGNLVTNANWEHFWLNEGFTVFLERKIIGALAGNENNELVRSFAALCGINALEYTLEVFGIDNPLTALHVTLQDVDPDDAFSSVPYEKGFNFLYYLETQVGGPSAFDPFLKSYIQEHAYKSIKSDVFVSYFKSKFPKVGGEVEWEKWLTTPGMPLVTPAYDTTLQDRCQQLAKKWSSGDMADGDLSTLTTNQVISTLTLLHKHFTLGLDVVENLDHVFDFGSSKNAEILFSWCRVCIKARYTKIVETALNFITTQGRMKFVRPLYRDLLGWKEYRQRTVDNFNVHKMFYHNICRSMVEKDIQSFTY